MMDSVLVPLANHTTHCLFGETLSFFCLCVTLGHATPVTGRTVAGMVVKALHLLHDVNFYLV